MRMPRLGLVVLVSATVNVGGLLSPMQSVAGADTGWAIVDVGTLGQSTCANAINGSGQVAGRSGPDTLTYHAFRRDPGAAMRDLGVLGSGPSSYGEAINGLGHVAGGSQTTTAWYDGYDQHAFIHDGTVLRDLGTLPDDNLSTAYDINDSDEAVGASWYQHTDPAGGGTTRRPYRAFLHDGGQMTEIPGAVGYNEHYAQGINGAGKVVGYSYSGLYRAWFWDGTATRELGSGLAADVNDANVVVGSNTAAAPVRGILWKVTLDASGSFTGAAPVDLGAATVASGTGTQTVNTYPQAVNSAGAVVGWGYGSTVGIVPLWNPGSGWVELNTLLPAGSGWRLSRAWDINDRGQIVGCGNHNGREAGFLMTPTSSSADLSITGAASPEVASPGEPVTFSLTVSNLGPDSAQTVAATQRLYAMELISCSATGGGVCDDSGTELAVRFASLDAGATAEVQIKATFTAGATGTIIYAASVVSDETADPDPTNNRTFMTMRVAPPKIVSTDPADGATGVPVTTSVSATFDEIMGSFSITLTDRLGRPVAGVATCDEPCTTVVFTPNRRLIPDKIYTAMVSGSSGNGTAELRWSFTTGRR